MTIFQLGLRSMSRSRITGHTFCLLENFSTFQQGADSLRVGSLSTPKLVKNKPDVCTADELHYVTLPHSDWKLALWRYLPSPKVKPRKHPLLLLSGVGNNAVGYDLSPEFSFALFMAANGFDTWTLEVRGSGLSVLGADNDPQIPSTEDEAVEMVTGSKKSQSSLSQTLTILSERISDLFDKGKNATVASEIRDLSKRLVDRFEGGHQTFNPQFFGFQENLATTLEGFLKQLDLIIKYDWDFDDFLEEDLPAVMEYIKTQCKPKDGKLHAIGHSMGGILLYSMLSQWGFEGRDPVLASVATLGSSLDYSTSKSSLKLLLPVAEPAKALNLPAVPIGSLISAIHTLASRPPYLLSWLSHQISAPDMMQPELLEKLCLNNFCTVPSKLLLQLTTAFEEGGLRDRNGTFFYKAHLGKTNVPVLALAGDEDRICPPEAVYETAKVIPKDLITYRVFGELRGPHYAHYDLVGGRWAVNQVYPCILNFLDHHDV